MIAELLVLGAGALGVWGLWTLFRRMSAGPDCLMHECPSRDVCSSVNYCRAERRITEKSHD